LFALSTIEDRRSSIDRTDSRPNEEMIAPSRSIDEMDAAESSSSSPNRRTPPRQQGMTVTTSNESPALPAVMKEKTRTALHRFFYPHQHKEYLGTQSTRGNKTNRGEKGAERGEASYGDNEPASTDDDDDPLEPPPEPPATMHEHSNGSEILHTPTDRNAPPDMNDPDVKFVTNFWTTFDDILILSIFTQLGIVFRIAIAIWFTWFDGVFSNDSALFVNLPLNCLSCFLMGVLCSGERLMEIITTRFSPPRTQQAMVQGGGEGPRYEYEGDDDEHDMENNSSDGIVRTGRHFSSSLPSFTRERRSFGGGMLRRRRRMKKEKVSMLPQDRFISWQPPVHLDEELRDVQLLALERRIRMSKCLVLFPVRKQDVDVMEHYFQQGYKRDDGSRHDSEEGEDAADHRPLRLHPRRLNDSLNDLDLREEERSATRNVSAKARNGSASSAAIPPATSDAPSIPPAVTTEEGVDPLTGSLEAPPAPSDTSSVDENGRLSTAAAVDETTADYITDFANNIQDNVQENLYRLGRVNLADGWDSGTTAEAMSDDLMLGLRDGFCGALSSFSSWNSAMVSLLRHGNVGQAVVGYIIGLQLPIVAYRFGQHAAVYIFVWRTRRETRKDERRGGYGIRLSTNDDLEQYENSDSDDDDEEKKRKAAEDEMPSLRAVITAIFIMALVTQITSIFFFNTPENQQIALSLLFSPLGVFARWRLAKLNRWKPTFPIGTFSCNILSCALSGSLGTLLSGNIGENQQIVLSSIVNGFGGTLSSLASFIVEILAGVDPILLRYDGVVYAAASIGCAMVVGFVFSASVEWADVVTRTATAATTVPSAAPTIFNVTDNLTRYW
jgi:fluoride ion exporter CrcB/FEX